MASRASVDFSLVDSRAKEVWLPGRGAQRDAGEREIGRFYLQRAFTSPQDVVSAGTDCPAKGAYRTVA